MSGMRTSRRLSGFTLVELLVVISIIALLVAILLPVLAKARTSAHIAKCLSNMRQQGIALEMYHSDFKGYFMNPWYVERADLSNAHQTRGASPWPVMIHSYLAAPFGTWTDAHGRNSAGLPTTHLNNAWTCPQGRPGWGMRNSDSAQEYNFGTEGGTYSYNQYLYHFQAPVPVVPPNTGDYYKYPLTTNNNPLSRGIRRIDLAYGHRPPSP